MADEDFDQDDSLLGTGQEGQQDRWLTDEQYASGKWFKFALERLLPMAQSTRLTTSQMEYLARTGWIFYVPRWVWVPRMVETNFAANNEKAIFPMFSDDGSPFTQRGQIVFMQGSELKPAFLPARKRRLFGNTWYDRVLYSKSKQKELKEYFSKGGTGKRPRFLQDADLVRVRYWIPTPILSESFVQAPRLPFDMVPKVNLNEAYKKERQTRREVFRAARARNARVLAGQPYEEIAGDVEFVDYQYCGCPGLDEELIRAYRTNSDPRVAKLPQNYRQLVRAGVRLWKKEGSKFLVARWVENQAGITLRVHRKVAENFVTAKQVFERLEQLKQEYFNYSGPNADKLRYDPDPTNIIPSVFFGIKPSGDVFKVEETVRKCLVALAKVDFIAAAKHQRKIREKFESWLENHYDRTLPCEQHSYHKWFSDIQQIQSGTWASQADRWFYQMQLRINFKKAPGIISSTSQRANFLEMEIQVADFESWRNLEHMQEHWKYSKAMQNTLSSFDDDKSAPKNMRQRDWGGIWNPTKAELDWRFSLLDAITRTKRDGQRRRLKSEFALRRRTELLNHAWVDKDPWQMMDHDGSLIDRFGQKKVVWIGSMRSIKGYSSAAGTFTFPRRRNQELEKALADFRDYDNEYRLLLLDEYFARDPVDVMENQKGIVIFSVLNDVNARLKSRYAKYPAFRLSYDNCCQGARLLEKMWKLQPVEPIIKAVEGSMRRWKRENTRHFRVEINKMLEGVYINKDLRRQLERWYRESDERFWEYVYYDSAMMSTMTEPGAAYGFGVNDASKAIDAGFGMGYGPLEMWQHRQEALMEIALYTGYFTVIKGVLEWWSVRVDAVKIFEPKSWPDINDLKLKIAGLLDSRKLIWVVAEQLLWPLLKIQKLLPSGDDPFPFRLESVDAMDKSFVFGVLNERAGTDKVPSLELAELDPRIDEVRTELIQVNQGRYNRLAMGRFHEINS